ncbi:MAG: hypothetical protein Q9226_006121, partial [Calogaya cf. arnoldii]
MLQDSIRTAERNLAPSGPVLGDDQFTDRSNTSGGFPIFPASSSTDYECVYSNCVYARGPTASSRFDSHHPSPYWPNNSRYVNGYYTPLLHQIIGPINPYLRPNDGRSIDYTTGLTNAPREDFNKENEPPNCPFCIDADGTGSWLLNKQEKELLLEYRGCAYHRDLLRTTNPTCPFCIDFAGTGSWLLNKEETEFLIEFRGCAYHCNLLPFAQASKLTVADSKIPIDFYRSTDDLRNESTKNPSFQKAVVEDHKFPTEGKGLATSRSNHLTFAEYFKRMTRKRGGFCERHMGPSLHARHELANHEDDVEKGHYVDIEKGGHDD